MNKSRQGLWKWWVALPYPFFFVEWKWFLWWIDSALNNKLPDKSLFFEENVKRAKEILWDVTPIAFDICTFELPSIISIRWMFRSKKWDNLNILTILLYAKSRNLTIQQTLELFSKNSQLDYPYIKALKSSFPYTPISRVFIPHIAFT